MSPSVASSFAAAPASWPKDGEITPEWVRRLASSMEANTRDADATPRNLARVCPKDVMAKLFGAALELLREERALVALDPPSRGVRVNVVGDTHGQLHDFLKLLDLAGAPSETNWFVFNGDFVDRGAWGVELFALALAWKVCLPAEVTLLRGNHECEFCTEVYGYKRELLVKYGNKDGRALYRMFLKVAQELPLAARVGAKTLVLHGGLFRAPGGGSGGGGKKKPKPKKNALVLGALDDLASAWKGGPDPDGEGDAAIASDVLWSDPCCDSRGLVGNDNRGIGCLFGADATDAFLRDNGLTLILRSHEGPDAREDRVGMADITSGFAVDHDVEHGKLCTVFSAPDYPQFIEEGERRNHNRASYVVLTGESGFCEPAPVSFTAVKPRPSSEPYYDVTVGGSDEEGPDGDLRETHGVGSDYDFGGSDFGGGDDDAARGGGVVVVVGGGDDSFVEETPDAADAGVDDVDDDVDEAHDATKENEARFQRGGAAGGDGRDANVTTRRSKRGKA